MEKVEVFAVFSGFARESIALRSNPVVSAEEV